MNRLKLLFLSYLFIILALFFYSFTQVDLSLTLSKLSVYQALEKNFQYLGFFNRPLSTEIFSLILIFLFSFYFLFLYYSRKDRFTFSNLKLPIFLTFIFLVFSYNAFSYDLFNYIFDAKIVTFYHLNPYVHKALDFTNDPMLSFMRWTHRYYPYGPFWLILTVPLSFIGMNYFLPTFFIFKFLMGLSYLGSVYLVYKISELIFSKEKIFNTVFFAFNPLIIIESLVSAHNDIPMIFLFLLSVYLYLNKKQFYSVLSYIFSVGIKFSTGAALPVLAYVMYLEKTGKKINWEKVFVISVIFAAFTVIIATQRTNFQPWYLLFPLSVATFVSKKYYIFIPSIILSVFASAIYIPYVLLTDYGSNYPSVILIIEVWGLIATVLLTVLYFLKIRFLNKH